MTPKKWCLGLLVVAVAACSGRSSRMQRDQQQYDVVQEGSADGVTSTINAPGETTPPTTATAITDTNIDTTTNFLSVPSTTTPQQPGTIAATLPQTTYTPRPRPARPNPETTTNPPTTETTSTSEPPTTTDTAAPTTASTTSTSEKPPDPPPPPTRTDTIGARG
jgi:hypothetical protein